MKIILSSLLFLIYGCTSNTQLKLSNLKQKHQNKIKNNFYFLEFTAKRYKEQTNDTYHSKMKIHLHYVNDSISEMLIEYDSLFKHYKNGEFLVKEPIFENNGNFELFWDNVLYWKNGKYGDSSIQTYKYYCGDSWFHIPLWTTFYKYNFSNFKSFIEKDKVFYDTINFNEFKFVKSKPIYIKKCYQGTSTNLIDVFNLKKINKISYNKFYEILNEKRNLVRLSPKRSFKSVHNLITDTNKILKISKLNYFDCKEKVNKKLNLNDSQLYIIDFTYIRCAPCISLLNILDTIKDIYKSKIEIIPLDPLDKYPKDSSLINYYFKKYKSSHNLFLIDKNELFRLGIEIEAYPHLLIVKNNKIIKVFNGYQENGMLEKMLNVIDENLKMH